MADDTPVPLTRGPRVVLHVVPVAALDPEHRVDLAVWERVRLPPLSSGGGWNHRFGIDGFTTWSGANDGPKWGYALVMRNGAIEALAAEASSNPKEKRFNPAGVEEEVVKALRAYLPALKKNGAEAPVVILLSVLDVAGYEAPTTLRFHVRPERNHRDALVLPDVLVDDLEVDVPTVMRPTFDALWQAFGFAQSLCYAEDGTWEGTRFRW